MRTSPPWSIQFAETVDNDVYTFTFYYHSDNQGATNYSLHRLKIVGTKSLIKSLYLKVSMRQRSRKLANVLSSSRARGHNGNDLDVLNFRTLQISRSRRAVARNA